MDSVQSQANRFELALLDAVQRKEIKLPLISLDFGDRVTDRRIIVTSLEAPHRMADALFRDSLYNEQPFRESDVGCCLDVASQKNATAVFGYCPTALLFGMWDSTRLHGGIGPKFTRALVSEIIAIDAVPGKKVSSRIDPVPISATIKLFKAKEGIPCAWTLDEAEAVKKAGKPVPIKGQGRPSEANLGNIAPSCEEGGITMSRAQQTVVLSLPALRQLQFPLDGATNDDVDSAARTVLAAIGLCAVTLAHESGYFLRSRCHLLPTGTLVWELLNRPGTDPERFQLTVEQSTSLLGEAVNHIEPTDWPWSDEIKLQPSEALVNLVRASHDLIGQGDE